MCVCLCVCGWVGLPLPLHFFPDNLPYAWVNKTIPVKRCTDSHPGAKVSLISCRPKQIPSTLITQTSTRGSGRDKTQGGESPRLNSFQEVATAPTTTKQKINQCGK